MYSDRTGLNFRKAGYLPNSIDTGTSQTSLESKDDGRPKRPNITLVKLHKQAIICDGSQAFLQLTLNKEDRDATRFLWFRSEKEADGKTRLLNDILIYRFSRLPIGLRPSPFFYQVRWGEILSPNIAKQWKNWVSELPALNDIGISRWNGVPPSSDNLLR
ncbi:hypothetical protein AVEN_33423-1 [Araneus ventricosus]|uniref:Uncharacterized protein n=1 Tax=Araneus ventricosus TaxID=182803 RepID=A0A4Y2IT47_ARAVE|nr:hypothetical protein AVEN_33423-1 [Araneus ventricosus]